VEVLDVSDSFAEQLSDVLVMQRVDDAAALAPAADQSKMAQQPQLVRDGGRLHAHVLSEFVHRARAGVEPPEDAQAARRGERLHGAGDHPREGLIKLVGVPRWASVATT
jgi:hypothetical protein